jgi:hypothetical protein
MRHRISNSRGRYTRVTQRKGCKIGNKGGTDIALVTICKDKKMKSKVSVLCDALLPFDGYFQTFRKTAVPSLSRSSYILLELFETEGNANTLRRNVGKYSPSDTTFL